MLNLNRPKSHHFSVNKSKGFTLIEILVVVFIFGVIISIVGPAILQFFDAREKIIAKQEQLEGIQKTFLFLARDLRYAANRVGKDEFGDELDTTLIIDDDSLLALTASYPDLNLNGLNVPRKIRWELERGELIRWQSPALDPEGDTRQIKQVLLTDVRDVDFEIGVVDGERDTEVRRWNEPNRLPDLLRITIKLENQIEYQRSFGLLGSDKEDAAAVSSVQGNPIQENAPRGGDNGQPDPDREPDQGDI